MKLLIYDWPSYYRLDLYSVFHDMGIEYDLFQFDFQREGHSKHYDEEFVKIFKENYSSKDYDAIFSIAYWAVLSDAAMATDIKYISWSYDCPLDTKNPLRTLNNPCNYVFLFDKKQVNSYKSMGIDTVYHMPLGINKSRYVKYSNYKNQYDKFQADISFVGNLYIGSTLGLRSAVSEHTKNIMEQIIEVQKKLPGKYVLEDLITDSFISLVNKEIEEKNPYIKGDLDRSDAINTFAYEVTSYNRMMLLMLMGKRHRTVLYTNSDIKQLSNVEINGGIDYYDEMPWCFAGSKINLNSTFISIQTGLPLRVLDIMACGGFLLSNRQAEFAELGFTEDEDLALFTEFDEAIEKAEYYLSKERVREVVAKNGRRKVFEGHRMDQRLKDILYISGF